MLVDVRGCLHNFQRDPIQWLRTQMIFSRGIVPRQSLLLGLLIAPTIIKATSYFNQRLAALARRYDDNLRRQSSQYTLSIIAPQPRHNGVAAAVAGTFLAAPLFRAALN